MCTNISSYTKFSTQNRMNELPVITKNSSDGSLNARSMNSPIFSKESGFRVCKKHLFATVFPD